MADELKGAADYAAYVLPEPFTLLGLDLLPLSLGHLMYLERLECDPVDDENKLVLAVIICSRKVEDIEPTLRDRWLGLKLRVWRWRLGKIDWLEKITLWGDYLKENTQVPEVAKTKKGKSGDGLSGTPFTQHVKVVLQSKLNYSLSEALNCGYAQAMFDYYTFQELEGALDVVDRKKINNLTTLGKNNAEAWIKRAKELQEQAATNGSRTDSIIRPGESDFEK